MWNRKKAAWECGCGSAEMEWENQLRSPIWNRDREEPECGDGTGETAMECRGGYGKAAGESGDGESE